MVDEQGAGDSGVRGGVEGAFEGGEEVGDVAVEVTDFAGDGADEFGLVRGKVGEGLGAFGVLDLFMYCISIRSYGCVDEQEIVMVL